MLIPDLCSPSHYHTGSSGDELDNNSTTTASAGGVEGTVAEETHKATQKRRSRKYNEDMCITSSHLREVEDEEEQDLVEEEEDEDEEEVERELHINDDSEASDTESRSLRGHDRVQVSRIIFFGRLVC